MLTYTYAQHPQEFADILTLQKRNLPATVSKEEMESQGFVTVVHDLPLLAQMNTPYPHALVKDGDQLIGYALVMLREMANTIPVLVPMFDLINQSQYQDQPLSTSNYAVMGQICIDKAYRGKGLFQRLYQLLKEQMKADFDYLITEVSARNARSLAAHYKLGFQVVKEYKTDTEEWVILLWDWTV